MSQHQKNQPDYDAVGGGRNRNNNKEASRYEGFEGMNYEQERQPYNNQGNTTERNGDNAGGSGSERNDRF